MTLAEVFHPTPEVKARGSVVRPVLDDETLSQSVATVDDLDDSRGRAVLPLAIDELVSGRAGHYGEGPGATSQLPESEPEAVKAGGLPSAAPR